MEYKKVVPYSPSSLFSCAVYLNGETPNRNRPLDEFLFNKFEFTRRLGLVGARHRRGGIILGNNVPNFIVFIGSVDMQCLQ